MRRKNLLRSASIVLAAACCGVGCSSIAPADQADHVPSGWPVDPRVASVSSGFGVRRSGSWHQGIDLSAPGGTPVRATADGRVVVAEREGGYGRTVVIDHGNGYRTRYAHLKRIAVDPRDRVRRGDLIGKVGQSGNASGFHLHYEIVRDGSPIDPRPFMN